MSDHFGDDTKDLGIAHEAGFAGEKKGDAGLHLSETLLGMPMAPSSAMVGQAVDLAEREKHQPTAAAFKAELWPALFSLCFILPAIGQGFDSGAGSVSVNMPAFLIQFGAYNVDTESLYVPSLWLALWNASSSLGNAIGSFITGFLTNRLGYRYTQLGACVFSLGSICLQVFAINREMILVGKLLNGVSMGLFVAVSAGYISEITGAKVRATMMSCLAASPIIGIIMAVGIGSNAGVIGNLGDWNSWKLIFALQWALPAMAIPLLVLSPDSPTDHVKRGKPETALAAIKRLRPSITSEEAATRLAGTQLAVAIAIDEAKSQSNSYLECFKGVDRKRTLTVMIVSDPRDPAHTADVLWHAVLWRGSSLQRPILPVTQTGIAFATVSDIALGFLAISAVVCVCASFLLDYFGRRNVLVYGSIFHASVLVLIGALYYSTSQGGLIATAMLFNAAISTAQLASGAPVYALAVEITSVRLRSKTQSLGFMAYYIMGWVFLFSVPYTFQAPPDGAGWGVRSCWLFAALRFIFAVFGYFYVPETKNRSYADIDELYHRGVNPRHFASTEVNAERDAVA